MRYFNESDANSFQKSIVIKNHMYEARASSQAFDVFLSHSSKDAESLPPVINFLSQYNVNVYVDKDDKELPRKTSPETGEKLKSRIYECRKFIVLVSENSKKSNWIPWELGIADERKTIKNVALLPKVQSTLKPDWPEQEYLGLYPRIINGKLKGYTSPVWMVLNHHKNTGTELGTWLKQ
jgi:hypothetical protein